MGGCAVWAGMWKLGICSGWVRQARSGGSGCHLELMVFVQSFRFLMYSRSVNLVVGWEIVRPREMQVEICILCESVPVPYRVSMMSY